MIRILRNIDIAPYISFGTSAQVEELIEWDNPAELIDTIARRREESEGTAARPMMILGEGCNTLFVGTYNGTILRCVAKGIRTIEEDSESVLIRVEAGERWDDVVAWCCARGLWGAENLSAIPSSVGASAVQNIGAYGAEAKEIIERVEYIDLESLTTKHINGSDCRFIYRGSIFKTALAGKALITAVEYRLSKKAAPKLDYGTLRPEVERTGDYTPGGIRRAVVAIRESKLPDPKVLGNAGSFFMNPILPRPQVEALKERYPDMPTYAVEGQPGKLKIATGWMIDHLGWKGKGIGGAAVHTKQALVLVNRGGATGEDVVALAERICLEVKEHFGVEIHPEVNIVR